jgi:plastocyanin
VSDAATIGAFTPPSVTASVGQTVAWVFQDANPHTVTADDDSFTSPKGGLANGKTYSHTFDKAGTYKYHCFIHPQMLGTVVVQ